MPSRRYNVNYDITNKVFNLVIKDTHKAGFWSVLGHSVFNGLRTHIRANPKIFTDFKLNITDTKTALRCYKDTDCSILSELYNFPEFLSPSCINEVTSSTFKPWAHHSIYGKEFVNKNNFFVEFFKSTESQTKLMNNFIQQYDIQLEDTLGVYYRKTDKISEIHHMPDEEYLQTVKDIKNKLKVKRLWLLTDQQQIKDMFVSKFKNECFFVKELPFNSNNVSTHHSMTSGGSKLDYIKNFDAVLKTISKCKYLINHTGNSACAIAMFRGSVENTWQVSHGGNLVALTK